MQTLYLNLAATYLKINDYINAKAACDEVLLVDADNVKALFRRAKARTSSVNASIEDYEAGLQDLQKAFTKDPNDAAVNNELQRVKHELSRYKGQNEKLCKEIFKEPRSETTSSKTETEARGQQNCSASEHTKDVKEQSGPSRAKGYEHSSRGSGEDKLNSTANTSDDDTETISQLSKKVSNEIEELGKFLENRGGEVVRLYEAAGRKKEAEELKAKLIKAMMAKKKMEKMCFVDITTPSEEMEEMARKFGLDLNDPKVKVELLKMHSQQVRDIKNMGNEQHCP